jgi:hypothetical protein
MSWDKNNFKEKLEGEHAFPCIYLFKFIVPTANKQELQLILPKGEVSYKKSKGDKYVSVSVKALINTSDEIISVYERAYQIEGIISL